MTLSILSIFKTFKDEAINFVNDNNHKSTETTEFHKRWEKAVIKNINNINTPSIELLISMFKNINEWFATPEKDSLKRIEEEINGLERLIDHIAVIKHIGEDKTQETTSIQEKLDFLLEQLYKVDNGKFYSIMIIYSLNGIIYRKDETCEIADNLQKRGLVSRQGYHNDEMVKITVKGSLAVERNTKTKKKEQRKNTQDKLDEIIETLKKQNLGQEILYDELTELKGLFNTLNKKNWGQLLKGKIMDMAVSEIISKSTAAFILESLLDEKIKIMK